MTEKNNKYQTRVLSSGYQLPAENFKQKKLCGANAFS